jgi:hypothetical protein
MDIEKGNLPEGITFNGHLDDHMDLELVQETINSTKCPHCDICLEGILLSNNNRHEGIIQAVNGKVIWKNALPKDRVRSIKMLNENLILKLDIHKERHKND